MQMGMIGVSVAFGFALGSLIFPRMADIYGRQMIFRYFFPLHFIGIAIILWVHSIYGLYLGLFLIGLASTVRTVVAYVYALEFFQSQKQNLAGTFLKTVDVVSPIISCIIFIYFTNNWKLFYYVNFAISITTWV